MGAHMVRNLAAAGHEVRIYARTPSRAEGLPATAVPSAREAAEGADVFCSIVTDSPDVREVVADALRAADPPALFIDMSTIAPAAARAIAAEVEAAGAMYVDAPVSGGPAGARSGTMTMLIGGDEAALRAVRSTLQRLAATIVHVGGPGAGHAAKIANNMLCAANLSLVAEATKMAAAEGVAPEKLMEAVNAGSGRSGVSEVNFPRWVLSQSFDSGFTMGLMRKDVALAAALAAETGVATPAFGPIAQLWADSSKTLPDDAVFNEMTGLKR